MSKIPSSWNQGETFFVSSYAPESQTMNIIAQRITPSGKWVYVNRALPDELLAASKTAVGSYIDMITNDLMLALDKFIDAEEQDANPAD